MSFFDPVINFYFEGRWQENCCEPSRKLYECELVFVADGQFTLNIDGDIHRMEANSLAIIPPNCQHESWTDAGETVYRYCLHFDWTPDFRSIKCPIAAFEGDRYDYRLQHVVPDEVMKYVPCVLHHVSQFVVDLILELFDRFYKNDEDGELLLWPILKTVINQTQNRDMARRENKNMGKPGKAVLILKEYIENHQREPIGFDDFIRETRLTKSYICKIFKEMVGMPPTAYLNELRLHHAMRLLKASKHNITEISRIVGFEDPNYFSRIFKQKFKVAPSKFIDT